MGNFNIHWNEVASGEGTPETSGHKQLRARVPRLPGWAGGGLGRGLRPGRPACRPETRAGAPRARVRSAARRAEGPRPRRLGHTHRRGRAYLLLLGGQLRRHVRPGRGRRLHPAAGWTGLVGERRSPGTGTPLLRPGASAALGRLAHGGAERRGPAPAAAADAAPTGRRERAVAPPRGGNASSLLHSFPHSTPPLLRRRECRRGTNGRSSFAFCLLVRL